MRSAWIQKRRGQANVTQLHYARQGVVTEEMAYVASRENLPESLVMEEVARGRMIIPANIEHPNLEPMAIGIASRCKVNANIGASPNASDVAQEVEKLHLAVKYGADTVMDLSTGGVNLDEVRTAIINASPVPIGTVPVYQALESVHGMIEKLDEDDFLHVIEKHCRQGVDYQTIHAGLLIEHLPLVKGRLTGHRQPRRWHSGPVDAPSPPPEPAVHPLRGHLRDLQALRLQLLPGGFPAARLPARRFRCGPAGGTEDAG